MDNLRNIIIGFANLIIAGVVVIATLVGFIAVGHAAGGDGFSVIGALGGGILGFISGCVATCVLAVLVDIHALMLRAEARATGDSHRVAAR